MKNQNPPMVVTRRRFSLLISTALVVAGWTHGAAVIPPGTNVVDDLGVLVVDDNGTQVVQS